MENIMEIISNFEQCKSLIIFLNIIMSFLIICSDSETKGLVFSFQIIIDILWLLLVFNGFYI